MKEIVRIHPHVPPQSDDDLRGMLHQPILLPEGLTARVMEGWQREQRQRPNRWTVRIRWPAMGLATGRQAAAWAACAALALFAAWTLVDPPLAQHHAEDLMTPDALAELSAGLL